MADAKLRHAIAFEAARLMYTRAESEYFTAKRKAAKRICRGDVKPSDLPSNSEVRDQVQTFARVHEGDQRTADLRAMRLHALRFMRQLCRFRPRLIGSVMTGHVRKGSDIDLHVFTDSLALVTDALGEMEIAHDVEQKRVVKHGEARVFTHVHVYDKFTFELTVYPEDKISYAFKSSITGKAIERASIAELEDLMKSEEPDLDLDGDGTDGDGLDRFEVFRMLLQPLEGVKQSVKWHPEGDALYHSLQVFELARDERAWDEEFLLAALLHDVGKAIDPSDHVGAALLALEGTITERTAFLIAHHMEAHAYHDGSIGARARTRLQNSEEFDDLMLLRECDRRGRVPGAMVGEVNEALEFIRSLDDEES